MLRVEKGKEDWLLQTLRRKVAKGQVVFNNAVQRGKCWDIDRKSLLIHSIIEDYFVPPLYAKKVGTIYDMLDGKQRATSAVDFLNNEYALSEDTPNVILDSGEEYEIAELRFEDLCEEIQDRILNFSFSIYYMQDPSNQIVKESFFRLNNGKQMKPIELTRVKASCLEKIQEICTHDIFKVILKPNNLNSYKDEDVVIKGWALLFTPEPSFDSDFIRPLIESTEITDEQSCILIDCFSRLLDSYNYILNDGNKKTNVICTKLRKPIHLLAVMPLAKRSLLESIPVEDFSEWIKIFFGLNSKPTSIDENYNEASKSGTTDKKNVRTRNEAITASYEARFVNENKTASA